ncbi:hypothetical protein ACHWQZ_G010722 [Mnemiopsis leidyi]
MNSTPSEILTTPTKDSLSLTVLMTPTLDVNASNLILNKYLVGDLNTLTQGTATLIPNLTSSSTEFSTRIDTSSSWTVNELAILGGLLWFFIIIILIGNLACMYAVIKNMKAFLKHPFFQSNMFCVYLSFADVFQVVLVGIPAALSFTTKDSSYGDSFYNRAVVNPLLDFVTWLQLLLVVAICVDRAGHIFKPLRYSYSVTAAKTLVVVVLCTAFPFLTLTLPHIIAAHSTISYWKVLDKTVSSDMAYKCDWARVFSEQGHELSSNWRIFMSCELQTNNKLWNGFSVYKRWMNIANPVLMLLAVTSLIATSGIIIFKLNESAKMQSSNAKRQDEVAKSIRLTCLVSFFQAVLILVSTLPLRWYQIDDRVSGAIYTSHYKVIARALVFLGPTFNPWLYPIRMASIRSFLITKKRHFADTVSLNLTRLKSSVSLTQLDRQTNFVNTKLLSPETFRYPGNRKQSTPV